MVMSVVDILLNKFASILAIQTLIAHCCEAIIVILEHILYL